MRSAHPLLAVVPAATSHVVVSPAAAGACDDDGPEFAGALACGCAGSAHRRRR